MSRLFGNHSPITDCPLLQPPLLLHRLLHIDELRDLHMRIEREDPVDPRLISFPIPR